MRARGVGRASGAPIVDLGVLVPVSMTEKRQVTSTPEVPGPSRSWNPVRHSTNNLSNRRVLVDVHRHRPNRQHVVGGGGAVRHGRLETWTPHMK